MSAPTYLVRLRLGAVLAGPGLDLRAARAALADRPGAVAVDETTGEELDGMGLAERAWAAQDAELAWLRRVARKPERAPASPEAPVDPWGLTAEEALALDLERVARQLEDLAARSRTPDAQRGRVRALAAVVQGTASALAPALVAPGALPAAPVGAAP